MTFCTWYTIRTSCVSSAQVCRISIIKNITLLVLLVVYVGEDYKEPEFHYVPETHRITTTGGLNGHAMLAESLMLLREGIESGAATAQFELLYRRKPGLTNQCE